MSRSKHTIMGKEFPAKTDRRKVQGKQKKSLGFTSGTHSGFDKFKAHIKKEFEESSFDDPSYAFKKRRWEEIKNQTYPKDGVDYIKYCWEPRYNARGDNAKTLRNRLGEKDAKQSLKDNP